MMIEWMAYAATVGVLISAAAFAAQYMARSRRAPGRWVWMLAIVLSLSLPLAVSTVRVSVPAMWTHDGPSNTVALREFTSQNLTPARWSPISPPAVTTTAAIDLDLIAKRVWLSTTIAMLTGLAVCSALVFAHRRRWAEQRLAGSTVSVSTNVGPAVVGFLRPRIVVPAWLLQTPATQQELVIAHEQSHLDARDSQLLTLALLLLVAMPWNLPLWWQFRRLRQAIEVDCDARVLAKGHDRRLYASTLIDIGEQQSSFIHTVTSMAESKTFLEQRIRIMLCPPKIWVRRFAPVAAGFALCLTAMAAQVGPPKAEPVRVAIPSSTLQAYTGYFLLNEYQGLVVTQSNDRLSVSFGRGRAKELIPVSPTKFAMQNTDFEVLFAPTKPGASSTALTLRVKGMDGRAERTGADQIGRVDERVAQRRARQVAFPDGREILERNLRLAQSGKLQMNDFSPAYAALAQQGLANLREQMADLGEFKSTGFNAVSPDGWDVYTATYERGQVKWAFLMNPDGKIIAADFKRVQGPA